MVTAIKPASEAREVDITPEIAKELLAINTNNRPVRLPQVIDLATAMMEGRWRYNGGTIVISSSGRLLDGQHRLEAILRSGVTIKALVVFNVEDEAQDTIDQGKNRSIIDILKLRGFDSEVDTSTLRAVAKMLVDFDEVIGFGNDRVLYADYIAEHHDELAPWVRFATKVSYDAPKVSVRGWNGSPRRSVSKVALAALAVHMQRHGADPATIQSFFHGTVNGFALNPEVLQSLTPERLSVLQAVNKRLMSGFPLARFNGAGSQTELLGEFAVHIVAYGRYVDNVHVTLVKSFKDTFASWQDLPRVNRGAVVDASIAIPSNAEEIDEIEFATQ